MSKINFINQIPGKLQEPKPALDYSSHQEFFDYYANASQSPETVQRICSFRDCVLRVAKARNFDKNVLQVADIGCGAGTQSLLWAELGHAVYGLDVNEPLLELAKTRAARQKYAINFRLGSATNLPWPDSSMDVCLLLELLEHVDDWQLCLRECARVLRPGGMLLLTTTNKMCPLQQEFNLPLYSWYPKPFKRYFEKLAVSTRPVLANYAKYPAVNWFSFYSLRTVLAGYGFDCLDRFDIADLSTKGNLARFALSSICRLPLLRWFAYLFTRGTTILAIRTCASATSKGNIVSVGDKEGDAC